MKKRPDIFLKHMFDAVCKIESYIKGYNREKFFSDGKTIDAVVRQLEIIGEAARHVPSALVSDSPIPWKSIIGMRNMLIHVYFGVEYEVVWETATVHLKILKKYLNDKVKGKFPAK